MARSSQKIRTRSEDFAGGPITYTTDSSDINERITSSSKGPIIEPSNAQSSDNENTGGYKRHCKLV